MLLESKGVDNVKNKTKTSKDILQKEAKHTNDKSRRRKPDAESSLFKYKTEELNVEELELPHANNELDSNDVRNAVDVSPVIDSVNSTPKKMKKYVKKISLSDHTSKHPLKKSKNKTSALSNDSPLADKSEINRDLRTIYVGNLPVDFKKKKLSKMLKQYGKIEKMWTRGVKPLSALSKKVALIKRKFHENQPPLMVHAVFETVGEAHNALKLNGELYEGCRLRVTMVKEKVFDSRKGVFVGNLPFEVKDDDLFNFFSQCGEIMNVRVVRDEKTGAGKGFGYVNFKSADSVELALSLKAEKLNGREVRIQRILSPGMKKKLRKKQNKSLLKTVSLSKKSFPPNRRKSDNIVGERKEKSRRKVTDLKKKILAKKLSLRKNADSS